jgi:hypothetical protein
MPLNLFKNLMMYNSLNLIVLISIALQKTKIPNTFAMFAMSGFPEFSFTTSVTIVRELLAVTVVIKRQTGTTTKNNTLSAKKANILR